MDRHWVSLYGLALASWQLNLRSQQVVMRGLGQYFAQVHAMHDHLQWPNPCDVCPSATCTRCRGPSSTLAWPDPARPSRAGPGCDGPDQPSPSRAAPPSHLGQARPWRARLACLAGRPGRPGRWAKPSQNWECPHFKIGNALIFKLEMGTPPSGIKLRTDFYDENFNT